jgi:hypothetical protein
VLNPHAVVSRETFRGKFSLRVRSRAIGTAGSSAWLAGRHERRLRPGPFHVKRHPLPGRHQRAARGSHQRASLARWAAVRLACLRWCGGTVTAGGLGGLPRTTSHGRPAEACTLGYSAQELGAYARVVPRSAVAVHGARFVANVSRETRVRAESRLRSTPGGVRFYSFAYSASASIGERRLVRRVSRETPRRSGARHRKLPIRRIPTAWNALRECVWAYGALAQFVSTRFARSTRGSGREEILRRFT